MSQPESEGPEGRKDAEAGARVLYRLISTTPGWALLFLLVWKDAYKDTLAFLSTLFGESPWHFWIFVFLCAAGGLVGAMVRRQSHTLREVNRRYHDLVDAEERRLRQLPERPTRLLTGAEPPTGPPVDPKER